LASHAAASQTGGKAKSKPPLDSGQVALKGSRRRRTGSAEAQRKRGEGGRGHEEASENEEEEEEEEEEGGASEVLAMGLRPKPVGLSVVLSAGLSVGLSAQRLVSDGPVSLKAALWASAPRRSAGWLAEEDARRSAPGDAVFDGACVGWGLG